MKGLTKRQEDVLQYIAKYIADSGFPPSYQEIADNFGIASKHGVVRHLEALTRKGYIAKSDTTARSIRIVDKRYQQTHSDIINLPLIGRVSAGLPILAESNIEDHIAIPRRLIKSEGNYFTLRVQGMSMINAGIMDNDLVIVYSTNMAETGQVVVALIEDEVTVKRLMAKNGQKYLKAENPEYDDIYPHGDWMIQGKVVGLIRDMVN